MMMNPVVSQWVTEYRMGTVSTQSARPTLCTEDGNPNAEPDLNVQQSKPQLPHLNAQMML